MSFFLLLTCQSFWSRKCCLLITSVAYIKMSKRTNFIMHNVNTMSPTVSFKSYHDSQLPMGYFFSKS